MTCWDDFDELEFEFHLRSDHQTGQGDYVLAFEGEARCWDDEASEDRIVGRISGRRIDLVSASANGYGREALLDTLTSELSEFSESVLQDEECLLPASEMDSLEAEICECIVFISELLVDSQSRGRGLGSQLMKRTAGMLDVEHCLMALKAFPLAEVPGQTTSEDEIAKVKGFYAKHGFHPAGGDFMVKDARLCEAMKRRLRRRRQMGGD